MNSQRFPQHRVLVSGAAQGIGRRIAERFVQEGALVVGLDLQAAREELPYPLLSVDVADAAAVENACAQAAQIWSGAKQEREDKSEDKSAEPQIDVLVNAAGLLCLGDLETLSPEQWRRSMDVNVAGPFFLMRHWAGVFKRQRRGAIVNIASNSANLPRLGMLVYAASKAALVSLSRGVALELAPYGVRCNIVSPGSTDTPMLADMLGDEAGKKRLIEGLPEQFKLGIPLGKIATPDDIANAVLFLASAEAGHITMQQIVADGGATLGMS